MPFSVPHALRAVAAVLLTVALVGLRPVPVAEAMPVEGYPSYQPQTGCSPRPKAGTVLLSEWLLRTYPGSGSSGISRDCGSSGVSEHKEGRAFDWRLDAGSRRDRGYARDFLDRVLATDRRGNAQALARRMGIMYLIWNDHIWSASSGYAERDYLHAACSRVEGCSTTLRHRDHMHISLTRRAARGRTSWYLARTGPAPAKPAPKPETKPAPEPKPPAPGPKPKPAPRPAPMPAPTPKPAAKPAPDKQLPPKRAPRRPDGVIDLRRTPYARISVPADGRVVETGFKVAAGSTYSVTAAGLYTFGGPGQVGDAVCTWDTRSQDWVSTPARRVKRTYGRLRLLVNGKQVLGDACRGNHTYRGEITLRRDQHVRLRVAGKHPSSRGRLTVVVGRQRAKVGAALPSYPTLTPAPTYSVPTPLMGNGLVAETVSVPAAEAGPTYTRGSLAPGALYRVTVSGVVGLGGRVRSNGQCVRVRGEWYEAASIDPRVPGQDHGNLYVAGTPFAGTPTAGGCSGNVHVGELVASERGRLRLDLWDPLDVSDNTGALTVLVQRVTPVPTPAGTDREGPRPKQKEWQMRREELTLDAGRARGSVSTMRLRKGERVRVTVTGRYTSGRTKADASCVRTPEGWLRRDPQVLGQDVLDVWVDGQPASWRAVGGGACSSDAAYTTRFTAIKGGPLRLAVFDLDHRDNDGTLAVTLRRLKG